MSYTQVGACPKCGAPIYSPSVWGGICHPPVQHSCACNAGVVIYTTSTSFELSKGGEQVTLDELKLHCQLRGAKEFLREGAFDRDLLFRVGDDVRAGLMPKEASE